MSSAGARQSETIFQAALDLATDERASYLDHACAGDSELRREVESLINAYEQAGSFIERPAIEVDAAVVAGQQGSLLVGQSIQHYRITGLLGMGGMGEVYRALDTELHRPVALKFLRPEVAADEKRMQRFIQEARAASALNHPNILTVYEIGRVDGARFFATEFVDGVTLREALTRREMKLVEVLDVAIQIASALVAAHTAGIVHRDIKPENIMIRRDGYVKVLDFGLAKLTERQSSLVDTEAATKALIQTDPGAVMGTASYMSPEQASAKETDARTDIWSLGIVLYEMVTGRAPFAGATPSHIIVSILEKEPLPLSAHVEGVPEALEWIVTEALTKDREERTQTARELLKKLQRLKQRVDTDAELERSVAPGILRGTTDAVGTRPNARVTDAAAAGLTTAGSGEAPQTTPSVSSAEYVVNQFKRHKWRFIVALSLVVLAVAGVGFGLYKLFGRGESARSGAPLKVTPLTSSPYIERNVAFSPDGKQVAYVWMGEKGDNPDLYVKLIGAGEPLRLTNSPGFEMSPAWSPDGRYIAFLRGRGEGLGFYIIPALGGAERKLADAYGWTGGLKPQALDWSPDGRHLAVVDKTSEDEPWSIFLVSVETGERRRLTQPPAGYNGDSYVSFSPDGSRLAFVRSHFYAGDIYTLPVAGGEPARITSDDAVVYGLAWTRDGTELVFSSDRGGGGGPALWRVPAAGGTPTPVAGVGENVHELSIARQGDRLAYAQGSVDFNIYRLELTSQAGGRRGAGAPASFISSTRIEDNPQFSPDGHRVSFRSNRSGSDEIWACDAEGKNLVQLTNFGSHSAGARWSPDGRSIAFNSLASGNSDIYVVGADGGSPRRLTTDTSAEYAPSWSRDGRWIYFASNRTGRSEIWKMPAAGGAAIQLTRGGGQIPVESPDGRTVYYVRGRGESGLWQVSTEGGEETQVFEARIDPGHWAVVERGIYFLTSRPSQGQSALQFFDFATRQTTQITTLEGPRGTFTVSGITVSPDERWVLYAQRDKIDFDLMLVENFR